MVKHEKVSQFYVVAFHGYIKEYPEESWTGVCGRARRVQLQAAREVCELLLSLVIRNSS